MNSKVGPKGQVVISKPTRDRLGIGPGWEALEQVVNDHVELYFIPPLHERSLKGSLGEHIRKRLPPTDWRKARDAAWLQAARQKERRRRKG